MKKVILAILIFSFVLSPFVFGKEVKYVVITSSAANLREKPTTKAPIITVGRYGDKFPLVEDLGPWLKIKLPDGKIAFVWTPLTRIETVKVVEKVVVKKEVVVKTPPPKPLPPKPQQKIPLPPTVEGKLQLGKSLYYQGKYKQAIEMLQRAILDAVSLQEGRKRQIQGDAYFFMGLCYVKQGKDEEALKAFKSTIRLVPDYSLNVTQEEYGGKVYSLWLKAEREVDEEEVRKRMEGRY